MSKRIVPGPRENVSEPFEIPAYVDVPGVLEWLELCEQSTEGMTPEQCAEELEAYQCDVARAMTSPHGIDMCPGEPGYLVTRDYTALGLRYAVARERFWESFTAARERLNEEGRHHG